MTFQITLHIKIEIVMKLAYPGRYTLEKSFLSSYLGQELEVAAQKQSIDQEPAKNTNSSFLARAATVMARKFEASFSTSTSPT